MTENTNIKDLVKLAFDRKLSYLNLQEKFRDELTFAFSGGMWRADKETIAFLTAFPGIDQITLEDIYNVPRQVNPVDLLNLCKEKYQFAANAWAVEYTKLARIRRAEDV
jgi:hypothetical protein